MIAVVVAVPVFISIWGQSIHQVYISCHTDDYLDTSEPSEVRNLSEFTSEQREYLREAMEGGFGSGVEADRNPGIDFPIWIRTASGTVYRYHRVSE